MFAFSLLQNSGTLKMFVEYFYDFCLIFGSKYANNEFKKAYKRIKQAITIRPETEEDFDIIYNSSQKAIEKANNSGIDLEIDCDPEDIRKEKDTFKAQSKFF